MKTLSEMVREFQVHVGAPAPAWSHVGPVPQNIKQSIGLREISVLLTTYSNRLKLQFIESDQQIDLRLELIFEELAELLNAISMRNKVEVLDALVDLVYVVVGTAVQFDLPFDEAFAEIHRSNMTKSSAAARHAGDKGKGPSFSRAKLLPILEAHQQKKDLQ